MDTLNIASTIQYANRLKEQRERAKAAEEARIKAEQEKKAAEEAQMKEEAERAKQNSVNPFARASQLVTNEPPSFVEQTKAQEPELLTRAFTVTTTRENNKSLLVTSWMIIILISTRLNLQIPMQYRFEFHYQNAWI